MIHRLEALAREEYIQNHSSPEPALLRDLAREANLTLTHPRMVSGHIQGLFLRMMVELLQPSKVLEIGTYIGYATISLALGLAEKATITTIEVNPELRPKIIRNLQSAGVAPKVELIIGDALEEIQRLPLHQYQLIYLDANKAEYPHYYETLIPHLPHGALILADNTLWGDKLWHSSYQDPQTKGIREFNQLVANDTRVTKVLLPLRDGLTMIKKI